MEAPRSPRIGELLIAELVLSHQQVQAVLAAQVDCERPFGFLAEQMFHVAPAAIEAAWTKQYLTLATTIDLDLQDVDHEAIKLLTPREAWQFHLLPLRFEDGQLVAATSRERLARTCVYGWQRFRYGSYLLVADTQRLLERIEEHYPWSVAEDVDVRGLARRLAVQSSSRSIDPTEPELDGSRSSDTSAVRRAAEPIELVSS